VDATYRAYLAELQVNLTKAAHKRAVVQARKMGREGRPQWS
jgi:hypothetical protein